MQSAIQHQCHQQRYTPVFVHDKAPSGTSRRAAVIAAAYAALVELFPSQQLALDASYAASLAALSDECEDKPQSHERRASCTSRIESGIAWGTEVAQAVLAWRATDGFTASYPPFTAGTAVGQWRPTPPLFGAMSAQGLAFTAMFVLANNTQFEPIPPRALTSATYSDDFNAVKALGRKTGSTRTEDQTALAVFWEGNASVHWPQRYGCDGSPHPLPATTDVYPNDDRNSRAAPTPASRKRARTVTTPGSGVVCTTRAQSTSATLWARRSQNT